MRILMITDEMLPGGVSRHVTDLANALAGRGIRVTVGATDGPFRGRLRKEIDFVPLRLTHRGSYAKDFRGIAGSLAALRRKLESETFEVIHTHKRYSDLAGTLLARRFRLPHVSTCHSTFSGGRWFSPFGEITIAVSKAIETMLIRQFGRDPETVVLIPNEIKPLKDLSAKKISQIKEAFGIGSYRTIVASIGQFVPSKDRKTLLEAVGLLKKKGMLKRVACVLVGHGDGLQELLLKVKELGIEDSVIFLPGTTNIEQILNTADFCVLTSVRDGGIPYVLMEAASLRKPHIATAVGGIPEFVVNGKTGMLVEPGNAQAIADAMEEFLRRPVLVRRLGKGAKDLFMTNHSSEIFVDRTIGVYERVLGGR